MSLHEPIPQNQAPQAMPETPQTANKPQREANGRFARGNAGGPGNPFGRQVGQLRKEVLAFMTQERMAKLIESMFEQALEGDMLAAKLLLLYAIGKPTEAPNPDQLDLSEFKFFQSEAGMLEGANNVKWQPDPWVVLTLMRANREAASSRLIKQSLAAFKAMDESDAKKAQEASAPSPVRSADSELGNAKSDDANWTPMSKEQFEALRERVRRTEEERRKKTAELQQEQSQVAMHAPSANGKLHPAAT